MNNYPKINNKRILVTGGAGFIGSNLCEDLLKYNNEVVCLDNFSTGKSENIKEFLTNKNFKLVVGDIRRLEDCRKAVDGVDIVFHEAALGSVPRSINDPITSNEVNVSGFLNMLVASRDAKVQRFIYAASSSTYGDSESLPKVEDLIGKPLSPYAVTKYVNELYAHVFGLNYGIDTIGLRYFNVFGRRQDPNGAYAAVIPKFIMALINHQSPIINGDGTNSRDFTYIENVIQANNLAALASPQKIKELSLKYYNSKPKDGFENNKTINEVFNIAYGSSINLQELVYILIENLSQYDIKIKDIKILYGPKRSGDIPHSLANIDKAKMLLDYYPKFSVESGLRDACKWYMNILK